VKNLTELIDARKEENVDLFYERRLGNTTHIAGLLLEKRTGLTMTAIPYNTNNMITDVISGNVDFMFFGTVNAEPLIKAGQLKAIAVTGGSGRAFCPTCRPCRSWATRTSMLRAISAYCFRPTRRAIASSASRAKPQKALAAPELKRIMETSDYYISGSKPDEFSAFLKKDYEAQDTLMREVGLKTN